MQIYSIFLCCKDMRDSCHPSAAVLPPLFDSPLGLLSSVLTLTPALAPREFGAGLPAAEYGDLRLRRFDMLPKC